jgi:hypothetical protein
MLNWIFKRIKWGLLAAALGGPVVGYLGFDQGKKLTQLETEGATADAYITGASSETRTKRGVERGTTYKLDLEWQDAAGQIRTASGVTLPSNLEAMVVQGGELAIETLPVRYLEADPSVAPVPADGLANEKSTADLMVKAGAGGGVLGWLGGIAVLVMQRRKKAADASAPV